MILRLSRARLAPGTEPELLDRLRALIPRLDEYPDRPTDFTYGFRHEGQGTMFLSLSVWPDFSTLLSATGGDLSKPVTWMGLEDLYESRSATTYERLPPKPPYLRLADARVLGVVSGAVKPNAEALAQSMIDRSTEAAIQAGALAAHRARRVEGSTTEIVVVVVWPDRDTLNRFVRARSVGALDRRFTDLMASWTFETYDTLDPKRLLVPPAGPAVFVADEEGTFVDATPGVERILGIANVFLFGRTLADLLADPAAAADLVERVRRDGHAGGTAELHRPDGSFVAVRYRAARDLPDPGQSAILIEFPDEGADTRELDEIVLIALQRDGRQARANVTS